MRTIGEIVREVLDIRVKQRERWGAAHDETHERFEWVGLIAVYAAQGRWTDVAALAIAAEEAKP